MAPDPAKRERPNSAGGILISVAFFCIGFLLIAAPEVLLHGPEWDQISNKTRFSYALAALFWGGAFALHPSDCWKHKGCSAVSKWGQMLGSGVAVVAMAYIIWTLFADSGSPFS